MTESDWVRCTHAGDMFTYLDPLISNRRKRLFVCACCRSVWEWISDSRSRNAVLAAERHADGDATDAELQMANQAARLAIEPFDHFTHYALFAGFLATQPQPVTYVAARVLALHAGMVSNEDSAFMRTSGTYLAIARDIFGNPFRPVAVDPAWLAWNNGTVVALAKTIYEDRRWDLMPILGDALEDAGCHEEQALTHCRGTGPHVRGCWVVDLMLGKE